jgi:hypothetical protein
MTDKPILFSAPMVRALLEGRKTQTRRLLKIKGYKGFFQFGVSDTKGYDWTFRRADHVWEDYPHEKLLGLLPIQVGDRLYVREAHYLTDDGTSEYAIFAEDSADVTAHREEIEDLQIRHPQSDWSKHLRLRPSIHMPRWASRLTLTVTDVRVQRLQDISEADAVAEGIERLHGGYHDVDDVYLNYLRKSDGFGGSGAGRESFRTLWNSLHGKDAWDANPWVVAYSFDVHRGNIDQMQDT